MSKLLDMMGLSGFEESKFKPYLKMAIQRMAIAVNKKTAAIKISQREIAKLLEQQKDEKAAIKVESIIREDSTIEAYGILELVCELLHERSRLIAAEKECPPDLKSAIHTIIWAANRSDIPELHDVKKQFVKKYGIEWVERAEKDQERLVNERVTHKLSIRARRQPSFPLPIDRGSEGLIFVSAPLSLSHTQPPSAAVVDKYLREIAKKAGVEWTPTERSLTDEEMVWSAMPAPTGLTVPMAPATGFSHLYNNDMHPPGTGPNGGRGGGGAQEGGGGAGGCGGGSGGMPVVQATPIPPSGPHVNKAGLLDFRPPGPSSSTGSSVAPPPPAVSAPLADAIPMAPSATIHSPSDVGGGGAPPPPTPTSSGDEGPTYDIPLPPSSAPSLPPPELPHAPSSSSGSSSNPPDVDDLLSRFNRLQGR